MKFIKVLLIFILVVLISGCTQTETVYESKPTGTFTPKPIDTADPTPTSSIQDKNNINETFNETPINLLPRWGKPTLNVFVNEAASAKTRGFNSNLVSVFKDSTKVISNSINNKLTFNFVNDVNNANIEVLWVEVLPTDALDAIGHTELKFSIGSSFKVIKTATIELLARKDGKDVDSNQALLLSLHELGHALGLDHSKGKDSIMYPELQENVKGPSQKDVSNLLELYKIEPLPDFKIFNTTGLKRVIDRTLNKYYLADVSFSVINDGLADSGDFVFAIELGDERVENNSTSLAPGGVFKIKYSNLSSTVDFSKIVIKVDPQNKIRELDESNTETLLIGS